MRDDQFKRCEKNDDKWYIIRIQIKSNIIIIVKHTTSEDVAFVVQSRANYNKINIYYSPYQL